MPDMIDREWRSLQARERGEAKQKAQEYLTAHPDIRGSELADATNITFRQADRLIWDFRKQLRATKKRGED